jgi:hypothetical protein
LGASASSISKQLRELLREKGAEKILEKISDITETLK